MDSFCRLLPSLAKKKLSSIKDEEGEVEKVNLVIGNESGDLDSAVSTMVMAYIQTMKAKRGQWMPVFNYKRQDLNLKTEVKYCLEEVGINKEDLVYGDDFKWEEIRDRIGEVMLVDHHVINTKEIEALQSKVKVILDHRPLEREPPKGVEMTLQQVGSCSTLVAREVFKWRREFDETAVLKLIRAAILMDTKNLCPEAKKVTQEDVDVLERIEAALGEVDSRESTYDKFCLAKSDVSSFSTYQLLRKDLKILYFGDTTISISMSTVPGYKSEKLLQRDDFSADVKRFRDSNQGLKLIVILVPGVLILSPPSDKIACAKAVKDKIMAQDGFDITEKCIIPEKDCEILGRNNPAVTRKKLLPLVREAVQLFNSQGLD